MSFEYKPKVLLSCIVIYTLLIISSKFFGLDNSLVYNTDESGISISQDNAGEEGALSTIENIYLFIKNFLFFTTQYWFINYMLYALRLLAFIDFVIWMRSVLPL